MRILVFGRSSQPQYEVGFTKTLASLGIKTKLVLIRNEIKNDFRKRIEDKYPFLLFFDADISNTVKNNCMKFNPDCVLFWRPTLIRINIIKWLVSKNIKIFTCNNDDPFNHSLDKQNFFNLHIKYRWFHYRKILKYCTANWFYRSLNLKEAKAYDSNNNHLLPPYYIKHLHYRKFKKLKKDIDIVFIGHYENDGRDKLILEIFNLGYKIKVFGIQKEWGNSILKNTKIFKNIRPVYGDEYVKTLERSKIGLCFFSKINRDLYTRRILEIPAAGTLLLSEYNTFIKRFFISQKEAVYFSSNKECISKIKKLIENQKLIEDITTSGQKKLLNLNLEIKDVAYDFIKSSSIYLKNSKKVSFDKDSYEWLK